MRPGSWTINEKGPGSLPGLVRLKGPKGSTVVRADPAADGLLRARAGSLIVVVLRQALAKPRVPDAVEEVDQRAEQDVPAQQLRGDQVAREGLGQDVLDQGLHHEGGTDDAQDRHDADPDLVA